MLSEYRINYHLQQLAERWSSADELDEADPFDEIIRQLTGSVGAGVTPATRDYLKSLIGNEFESTSSDFHQYSYIGAERGKTYLTVAGTDDQHQPVSIVLLLRVEHSAKPKRTDDLLKQKFPEFEPSFERAYHSVKTLLRELNPELYISNDFFKLLDFTITDRNGRPPQNIQLSGESIELPFALAIFSIIAKRDLPASIASTGRINEKKVEAVNNTKEKISAALTEFDEIEKFLHPFGAPVPDLNAFKEDIKAIPVNTLEDAIFECFKDYKQIVRAIAMPGLVTYDVKSIEVDSETGPVPGTEIHFNIAEGDFLDPQYLSTITGIDIKGRLNGNQVLVFSNARASWHIGAMCVKFFNTIQNLVVYDPKLSTGTDIRKGIVVTEKTGAPFQLGTKVNYRYL